LKTFIADSNAKTITSDNGSEFLNRKVKALFDKHNITHYTSQPGDKHIMGKVERFNRTLKDRMNKVFTAIGKPVWYNILNALVRNYNDTVHSATKQTPNSFTTKDEERLIAGYMAKTQAILSTRQDILVGDKVRLPTQKRMFDKGQPTYSSKVYEITDISSTGAVKVKDGDGEDSKFYKHSEVLPVEEGETLDRKLIKKAEKAHKVVRKITNQEGLNLKDILPKGSKRGKKPVTRFSLRAVDKE